MIIKDEEIVKIIEHVGRKLGAFKHTVIETMQVEVTDVIRIKAKVQHNHVDTQLHVVAKVECDDEQILVTAKGMVKYGFITLDLNKVAKEYIKDNEYIQAQGDTYRIKNEWIKSLQYGDGTIELVLK